MTAGRRATLLAALGNAGGVSVQVVAAAGISVLVGRSALAYVIARYLGAAYVVYLGVQAIRHRRSMAEALAWGRPAGDDAPSDR